MLEHLYTSRTGTTDRYLHVNRLSLRNNRLRRNTSRELPTVLEESMEYTYPYCIQVKIQHSCGRANIILLYFAHFAPHQLFATRLLERRFLSLSLSNSGMIHVVYLSLIH